MQILDYFSELLSVPDSVFANEPVTYLIDLWNRCIKFFCCFPTYTTPGKLIGCLFFFIRKLSETIFTFRFNELSEDQGTLINASVSEMLNYCLKEESYFQYDELPQLFCALIRLCCCCLGKKLTDNECASEGAAEDESSLIGDDAMKEKLELLANFLYNTEKLLLQHPSKVIFYRIFLIT